MNNQFNITLLILAIMSQSFASIAKSRELDLSGKTCGPYVNATISKCNQKLNLIETPEVQIKNLTDEQIIINQQVQNEFNLSARVGLNLSDDEIKNMQALLLSSVTILVLSKPDQIAVEHASRNKSQLSQTISDFGNEFAEHYGKMAAMGGLIYYISKQPDQSYEIVQTTFLAAATVFGIKELGKLSTNIKLPVDSQNKTLQWANTTNTADLAFPSGHVAATATFLALIEKYLDLSDSKTFKFTAITIYAATMWGRLHERQHFLSDVIASGVFYFIARGILNRENSETTNEAFYINSSYKKQQNGQYVFGVDLLIQLGDKKNEPYCIKRNGQRLSFESCIDKHLNPTNKMMNF